MSEELMEELASKTLEMTPELDAQHDALRDCLAKLNPRDRRTVLARYELGGGVKAAAEASGRTFQATYKALYRIRKGLFDCIVQRLSSRVRT